MELRRASNISHSNSGRKYFVVDFSANRCRKNFPVYWVRFCITLYTSILLGMEF